MNKLPHFKNELAKWKKGYCVTGVDEVGRGALAGPLVVGAICFRPLRKKDIKYWRGIGINDSKKLKPLQRIKLSKLIKEKLFHSIGSVSVAKINKQGITRSTQEAMRKAIQGVIKQLKGERIFVLSDAFYIRYLKGIGLKNQKAIVHGDEISIAIAAASVVAKVERDRMMKRLSRKHPNYFWGRNKGYGTQKHQKAIKKYGTTKLHRLLFLRKILPTHTS